jgi:ribosome recycling factor
MEETENRVSQDNCRKYDEEIANMVDQYHAFFDALKKGEGS